MEHIRRYNDIINNIRPSVMVTFTRQTTINLSGKINFPLSTEYKQFFYI